MLGACPAEEATTDSPETDTGTTEAASSSGGEEPTGGETACPAPRSGPTMHEDAIGMNEVWTADGSPHIVSRFVTIPAGSTLTIEPCAEVRMQAEAALVFGNPGATMASKLIAEGEPEKP